MVSPQPCVVSLFNPPKCPRSDEKNGISPAPLRWNVPGEGLLLRPITILNWEAPHLMSALVLFWGSPKKRDLRGEWWRWEGVAEGERCEEFFAQETQGSCKFLSHQGKSAVNQKAQWERFYKTWEPAQLRFSVPCVGIRIVSWVLVLQKTRHQVRRMGRPCPSSQACG